MKLKIAKMKKNSLKEVFKLESQITKPRKLNQTWIKDIGYDQAPYYIEKMGLYELEDFFNSYFRKNRSC